MFKADHGAVYKQLPIDPADQANAAIALRRPKSAKWFGFVARTPVFGAVEVAPRYNTLSRAWAALVNRILGIAPYDILAISHPRPIYIWQTKAYPFSHVFAIL